MAEKVIDIELNLIFTGHGNCGACINELLRRLESCKGIEQAHLHSDRDPVEVCVHYDPNQIALAAVQRLAEDVGATLSNGYEHQDIPFRGLNTADSAVVLTGELEKQKGVLHANVNYAAGFASVAFDRKIISLESIHDLMETWGATPVMAHGKQAEGHGHDHHQAPAFLPASIREYWSLVMIGLGGLFLLTGWLGENYFGLSAGTAMVLYFLSYIASGYETSHHALPALLKGKFDTDTLMLAAAIGAAILGEWAEGAFLLILFGLGEAGEHYALDRARKAIDALGELMPKTAYVLRGMQMVEVAVEQLRVNDVVVIRPGDRIPIDGVVVKGSSMVDQSPITGESVPVSKGPEDDVFAGSINHEAALEVQVSCLAKDSTLSRVITMVAEAQAQKSRTQQFTERFTAWFVPTVLILVVLVASVPPLFGWLPLSTSFYRAMLLLVAASPCALAVGTPSAILSGIARAARNGVLIKGGAHLENLGRLKVIAFDKTGTLTEGRFELNVIISLNSKSADEVLSISAAVEQQSNHPLAQALVGAARQKNLILPQVDSLENISGRGVISTVDSSQVKIGSLRMFEDDHVTVDESLRRTVAEQESLGRTTMILRMDDRFEAILALSDTPRRSVGGVMERLKQQGIHEFVMLTGDNPNVAKAIGSQVGMTQIKASLLPEAKLEAIRSLQKEYGAVAMVGDGVNDAPALATATVGIAMGGAGTAVALETADVALMADDLSKLPFAVGLSRASRRIIQQNLFIALGVIFLLIISSVLGWVPLSLAVVLHEGSTVVVALNALRLLGYRLPDVG